MRKKALLVYGYALKNSGDMAITEGALDLLLSEGHTVKLVMRYNKSNWEYSESISYLQNRYKNEHLEFIESPFSLDRDKGFINHVVNYIDGAFKLTGLKKAIEFEECVKWADVIYFNGGNLIRCNKFLDYARLRALFHFVPLAIKHNKPYGILPNSCSAINKEGKKYLSFVARHADWIYLREEQSYSFFQRTFPDYKDKTKLSTDLAYFIDAAREKNTMGEIPEKTVAITLRAYGIGDIQELNETDKNKLVKGIEKTIQYLTRTGFHVIIVAQSLKDKAISNEIYSRFKENNQIQLLFERNPDKLRSLYSQIDFLIGMRLHSIIMASSMGTPCIGYFHKEWGLKNPGIMKALGLPYYFLEDDEIQQSTIDNILQNRTSYSSLLKNKIEKSKGHLISDIRFKEAKQPEHHVSKI